MDTVYFAIDPGAKGVLTIRYPDGKMEHHFFADEDRRDTIAAIIKAKKLNPLWRSVAVMEEVHAIFGSSAKATFAFGETFGFFKGILFACNLPLNLVQPKDWQKAVWGPKDKIWVSKNGRKVIDTKATSITAARRLFPDHDLRRTPGCKRPDDNLCDSMLIAEYARRMNL